MLVGIAISIAVIGRVIASATAALYCNNTTVKCNSATITCNATTYTP